MGRKTYSAGKIGHTRALLVSNAGYVKPTAAQEGISMDTVKRWSEGDLPGHVTPEEVERETTKARGELAKVWHDVAYKGAVRALELLDNPKTGALAAATVGAIGTDKANLLTGNPTERVEVLDFASWLTRQRAQSGTAPRLEAPKTEESVAKQN